MEKSVLSEQPWPSEQSDQDLKLTYCSSSFVGSASASSRKGLMALAIELSQELNIEQNDASSPPSTMSGDFEKLLNLNW